MWIDDAAVWAYGNSGGFPSPSSPTNFRFTVFAFCFFAMIGAAMYAEAGEQSRTAYAFEGNPFLPALSASRNLDIFF